MTAVTTQDAATAVASGDVAGARAALIDAVRTSPGDVGARMFLWQVMALAGEWDKATTQLRSLASLSGESQMLSTVYGQALGQEKLRAEAYAGRGAFPVLVASSPWIEGVAQSLAAEARGEAAEAERLRGEAFDAAGDTPGEADGRSFTWVADVDMRLGPCFEAIVSGRWGLVPFEAVQRIKTEGARDLRDVIWLPVEMSLRSGQSAAALLPARYPGSEAASPTLQLGRATEWDGERPLGQRVWSFDDGSEAGLLDVRDLVMA